ncbi:Hypothetical protein MBVG_6780 [Mycoplasmopsis bovigenitalium 51080]|uniref:Rad50/SbcC-type AAA domain-containing protein n=1 Tax=Mycoplasmopsis bovigenitalium 51080 TaxID=1188235 RepID=N9TS64_9BACT|nr:hypothetical protein [Mycoplasmopsis bovigenitalium]ENY68999.1 Hypothetical protein MBVG_6780 [Mycoplasmopsis bovigenitalium 51080]
MKTVQLVALEVFQFKSLAYLDKYLFDCGVFSPIVEGWNASGKTTTLSALTHLLLGGIDVNGNRTNSIEPITAKLHLSVNGESWYIHNAQSKTWLWNSANRSYETYKSGLEGVLGIKKPHLRLMCLPDYFINLSRAAQREEFIELLENSPFVLKNLDKKFDIESILKEHGSIINYKKTLKDRLKALESNFEFLTMLESYSVNIDYSFELKHTARDVARQIRDIEQEHWEKAKINVIKELNTVISIENALIALFNKEVEKMSEISCLGWQVHIVQDKKTGQESLKITHNGVEYKHLNQAKKMQIACQFSVLFQNLMEVKLPLFIDNFERIDEGNAELIEDITKDRQVFVTRVLR